MLAPTAVRHRQRDTPMQIAITGCGWVTPRIAGGIEDVLAAYAQTPDAPEANYEPIQQSTFDQFPDLPGEASKEKSVAIAAIALEIAWKQAGLTGGIPASDRKGLVIGSALAGVSGMIDFANDVRSQSTRFVSPLRFPQTVGNYICGALARCYDFRGPASTIACGSASSLEAIREGCAFIGSRQADVVIAGGTELLSPELVEGLNQPDVRFTDSACLFVLEAENAALERGATILASIPIPVRQKDGQSPSGNRITSVAGFIEPRAIWIEKWVGRTLGADGAAAVAAAIGSGMGMTVPRYHRTPLDGVSKNDQIAPRDRSVPKDMLVRAAGNSNEMHELLLVAG